MKVVCLGKMVLVMLEVDQLRLRPAAILSIMIAQSREAKSISCRGIDRSQTSPRSSC